jgi:acyl-CoA hydrolase
MKNQKNQSPDETIIESNHIVLPSHTNALGGIFGGVLMSWIDIAAAICAGRYSRREAVTASIDVLHFLAPARLGDVVTLKARVIFTGKTSMVVRVNADAESRKTGVKVRCVTADLCFVALDENAKPTAVPALRLSTEIEKKEFAEAAARREAILEQRRSLKTNLN